MQSVESIVIQELEDLHPASNSGLYQLYQSVFGEPPEHQRWELAELESIFSKYCQVGKVFLAWRQPDNEIIGFSALIPLGEAKIYGQPVRKLFGEALLSEGFLRNEYGVELQTLQYIADLGVAATYRRQGIGSFLMRRAITSCPDAPAIIRVSLSRVGALALYKQLGFIDMGLRQTATYQQLDGSHLSAEKMLMLRLPDFT